MEYLNEKNRPILPSSEKHFLLNRANLSERECFQKSSIWGRENPVSSDFMLQDAQNLPRRFITSHLGVSESGRATKETKPNESLWMHHAMAVVWRVCDIVCAWVVLE